MKQKKKILQINVNLDFGSTGLIMHDIGIMAEKTGLFEAYYGYHNGEGHNDLCVEIGNPISSSIHAVMSRLFGLQGGWSFLSTINFIRKIKTIKPDIVHLHNLHSNYINIFMLLRYLAKHDIPTVITMHDCWWFTGKCCHYVDVNCSDSSSTAGCHHCPKRYKDIPSWLCDSSHFAWKQKKKCLLSIPHLTMVGCSDWICNEARNSFLKGINIRRIYNGVDTSVFNPKGRCANKSHFVVMGMANKWIDTRNISIIKKIIDNTDAIIMIVGCNSSQQEELSLYKERVRAIGFIKNRNDLAELYRKSDVFVNLTHADTLPTVNMEAICCGTPVITYDSAGSPELVHETTGVVIKEDDQDGIVRAIKEMSLNPMIIDGSKWADKFDRENNYNEYIKLYNQL